MTRVGDREQPAAEREVRRRYEVPDALLLRVGPAFTVSAKTGEGLEGLLSELHAWATAARRRVTVRFDPADGRRLALLSSVAAVRSRAYEGDDVLVTAELDPRDLERLKRLPGRMAIDGEPTA